jgi:hypothetical protein
MLVHEPDALIDLFIKQFSLDYPDSVFIVPEERKRKYIKSV